MTIRISQHGDISLQGVCPSEDAEVLLRHLLTDPSAIVNWQACDFAHTAVVQVLLLARPTLHGVPNGAALRNWVHPVLTARRG